MGKCCSKPKCVRLLIFGWESSGKTTILYRLKLGQTIPTLPTLHDPNEETVKHRNIVFRILDAGGIDQIRPSWPEYYRGEAETAQAVIFVVDSSDRDSIARAKDELAKLLNEADLSNAVFLVFANKQDLPDAMTRAEVIEGLDLQSFPERRWYVQHSCASTGEGLHEGLDWVVSMIEDQRRFLEEQGEAQLPKISIELSGNSSVVLDEIPFQLDLVTSGNNTVGLDTAPLQLDLVTVDTLQGALTLLPLFVLVVFSVIKALRRRRCRIRSAGSVSDSCYVQAEWLEEAEL